MSRIQEAVSTPITVVLADGKDHTFEPIGVDILCEFNNWLARQLGEKPNHIFDLDELLAKASTIPGMRWLLWRAYENRSKVKLERMGSLIGGLDRMAELFAEVADLPDGDATGSDPQEDQSIGVP